MPHKLAVVIKVFGRMLGGGGILLVAKKDVKRSQRETLKISQPPTREYLDFLMDPPAEMLTNAFKRKKANKSQQYWGLLNITYPYHQSVFLGIKRRSDHKKEDVSCDYEYTPQGFMKFLLDTGLPPESYKVPILCMENADLGFVKGNMVWKDKSIIKNERERINKNTLIERLKGRPFVVFKKRKFYKWGSEHWRYSWDQKNDRAFGEESPKLNGKTQEFLHIAVWESVRGPVPDGYNPRVKNLKGDLTDYKNYELIRRHEAEVEPLLTGLDRWKQSTIDVLWGYLKVCMGCGAEWRLIDGHVMWERPGIPEQFGLCEDKHMYAKTLPVCKSNASFKVLPTPKKSEDYEWDSYSLS